MMKQIEYPNLTSTSQKQQDAISRLFSGKETWNKWAEGLLSEKEALIAAGKWELEQIWSEDLNTIITTSEIPETQAWLQKAMVDFTGLTFTSRVKEYLDSRLDRQGPNRPNHLIVLEGEHIDLRGFIFPGQVIFNNCTFKTTTLLDQAIFQADANFNEAAFAGDLSIDHAIFAGDAWFEGALFEGSARFMDTKFYLAAWFTRSKFLKKAKFKHCIVVADFWINEAILKGRASFENTFFKSDIIADESQFKNRLLMKAVSVAGQAFFRETCFAGRTQFEEVTFRQSALFTQSDFQGYALFNKTVFHKSALFKAIHVKEGVTFDEVHFKNEVPNFRQALFKVPARFKALEILPRPKRQPFSKEVRAVLKAVRRERRGVRKLFFYDWVATGWWQNLTRFYWQRFTNARRKPTDEAYFKTLGRLAVEAGNLRAEKQFLAGQVRARRHMSDKITGLPTGTLNYLIGIISELTSNFGRSLLRPLYSWVLVFAVFTGIYLHEAENSIIEPCQNNESITPLKAAGELSLANALRVSWPFEAHMNDMHRCLYGEAIPVKKETKDQARLDAIEEVKDIAPPPPQPKIPHAVAMWGLLQTVLSFILMGVFVINLRNRFKM